MERLIQKIEPTIPLQPRLLRVAAYARVSSGKDAMLHSLSAQVSYYSELIQSNPEWLFSGIFADEALTGTKDTRPEFQKMLKSCQEGNIDLIITKSISRFARNTVTLLETVRELKDIGVDVFFEEQNIHSMSGEGELMLSILAGYAQEESLSASENKKWQIRNDFESGKVSNVQMLGYFRNSDGVLEIVSEEAAIVKRIFTDYLSGKGKITIANELNEENIPTKHGKEWTSKAIGCILKNEKYCGDLLLQKTFRSDHITKKKTENIGQLPKYYVEDAHEPIIDRATFQAVQKRLETMKQRYSGKDTTGIYQFSGLIYCSCCGKKYRRKTTNTGFVWICNTYNNKGKKYCPTAKQIPEEKLYGACCEVLGIEEFDEELFKSEIEKIIVPAPNQLIFCATDGSEIQTTWKDRSRSESWTDEMKMQASQHTKERRWG